MRPLYESAKHAVLDPHGHRGLWFDKFCDRWRQEGVHWTMKTPKGEPSPKLDWLQDVLRQGSRVGEKDQLDATTKRVARLVSGTGGRLEVFRTDDRFVTGLGRAHPLENGFAWHHTLGTPYLPGSSIKGLVRAWAESESEADPDLVNRLLGGREPKRSAGTICFLDALPIAQVGLEIDVLTPHYAAWSDGDPPGDWRSPIPVPFLVTAAKQRFVFAVIPSRGSTPADIDVVFRWLTQALEWEGAGAKTAVGYGRFAIDTEASANIRKAEFDERSQKLAESSLDGFWHVRVQESSEKELLDAILVNIEKNQLKDQAERVAFVAAVRAVRGDWLAMWRRKRLNDSKTGVGGAKLKARASLIDSEP